MLQIFCEVAYVAKTSDHLLDGIDEFIDDLTVLPPSIWDPTTRMEPPQKTISMVGVSGEQLNKLISIDYLRLPFTCMKRSHCLVVF